LRELGGIEHGGASVARRAGRRVDDSIESMRPKVKNRISSRSKGLKLYQGAGLLRRRCPAPRNRPPTALPSRSSEKTLSARLQRQNRLSLVSQPRCVAGQRIPDMTSRFVLVLAAFCALGQHGCLALQTVSRRSQRRLLSSIKGEGGSFLNKRTKKLSLLGANAAATRTPTNKSLLLPFFRKEVLP
jgi:hypothetical protein